MRVPCSTLRNRLEPTSHPYGDYTTMKNILLATAAVFALAIPAAAQQAVIGWGGIGTAQATSGTIQTSEGGSGAALAGVAFNNSTGSGSGSASAFGVGAGALGLGVGGGFAAAGAQHTGQNSQTNASGALGLAAGIGSNTNTQENSGLGSGIGFGGFGVVFP